MEIKAELIKPYTEEQRIKFIVEQNHRLGYSIEEQSTKLVALGFTQEELNQQERNRKDMLALTRCDVLKALYQAKGITPNDIKALLKDNVEALIELEYAQNFYRGHPMIKAIGEQLGFTSDDLDYLFENKKFKEVTN